MNEEHRWTTVSYEDFIKRFPSQSLVRSGIVDMMAAHARMIWMDSRDHYLHGFKVFCRPMIVGSSNASCTFRAVENVLKMFSLEGLQRICSMVPFVFVVETSDGAVSIERKKQKSLSLAADNCGLIPHKCGGHQGHRIVESREKKIVGHVHATAVTCNHVTQQSKMQAALWDWFWVW